MRVTALGTGMPNVITGAQKASAWYVELGNGDKFLFDVGSGNMENLAKPRPPEKGRTDPMPDFIKAGECTARPSAICG